MSAALAAALLLAAASPPDADASEAGGQSARISAAFAAAETLQGPLDGIWRLTDRAGRTLYVFALADPGEAPAPLASDPANPGVEGAWRDPSRAGAAGGSGLIDTVRSEGARARISFSDGRAETVSLRAGRPGRWIGTLLTAGRRRAVTMTRF